MILTFRSTTLLIVGTLLAASACQRPITRATPPAADCIDPAQIKPDGICTKEYAPVCGCNGQTYANSCAARNAGVRTFVTGPCPTRP